MDAGLLARTPIGRLRRPLGAFPGKGLGSSRPTAETLARAKRNLRGAIASHRRLRIALICLPIALPLLAGGWLWLRHSSFVAVEHVRVSGVHGAQAREIEHALTQSARGMSTMDVNSGVLRAAVARFPVVQEVRTSASFPHTLHIVVLEQQPVATLLVSGLKTAVAADGVVLGPELLSSSLPTLAGSYEPARGQHLHNPILLESLTVLGAAPPALAKLVERVYEGPRGLTVAMKNGLLVYFGDASRPHAKWLSLARVLADEHSAGALYVDVRLPGRPAARMSTEDTTSQAPSSSESTVSALAAGLTGGKSETSTEPSEEAETSSSAESPASTESSTASAEATTDEAAPEASAEDSTGTAETPGP